MRDLPIMFSPPMVRAVRGNRKTQTRRLAEPNWKVGDRLWVREAHLFDMRFDPVGSVIPEGERVWYVADRDMDIPAGKYRPAMHMPRWVSRDTLVVKAVRREPLQDLSERDARAEGLEVKPGSEAFMPYYRGSDDLPWVAEFPCDAYADLWDSLTRRKPGTSWRDNPTVWVTTFERAA